jgi:hypothetical protein
VLNEGFLERWTGSEWKFMQREAGEINDVACATTTACVAVGTSASGAAQSWMIFQFFGSWLVEPLAPAAPAGGTEISLKCVSCTATACTATGSYTAESTYKPLVERWNGSAWSLQTAPSPSEGSAQNAMLAVSCYSASLCMTVGEAASKPVAERWNGTSWSLTSAPPLPSGATGANLLGVSCTAKSSCIAAGRSSEAAQGTEKPLIESWNGSAWSTVAAPSPADAKGYVNFNDVSCLSPRSCFAAGNYASSLSGTTPLETKTLAETWDGTAWTLQSTPNPSGQPYSALVGVACTSSISCMAVGASAPGLTSPTSVLSERYE